MKLTVPTPSAWDTYLENQPSGHFLQSWAWGDFQEKLGNKIWRLVVEDNGETAAQILVIKLSLGFGQSILYAPRGNLINKTQSLVTTQAGAALLLSEIKKIAAAEKVALFRIDPSALADDLTTERFYLSQGFVKNPKNIQPRHSLLLNLRLNTEGLFDQMKPKTRYNIHLAERHGVTVAKSTDPQDFQKFLNLLHSTSNRQRFSPHPDRYYRAQFETLQPAGIQELWLARHEDKVLAAILVNSFNHTATYVHGALDNRYRELMAPHLLQFTAIQYAKNRGLALYDFWGIDPDPSHPWAGLTRFKRGFGGQKIEYIGTLELSVNPLLYKLYRLLRP